MPSASPKPLPYDADANASASDIWTATIVLLTPFVVIPAVIIAVRLTKYLWRRHQAKKYGYGDEAFQDPLAELGLKINRGYENSAEIRKIRKEQRKLQLEIKKRAQMEELTVQDPQHYENAGFFNRQIHVAETYVKEIRRQTQRTWSEKLSPDAIRRWVVTSRWSRAWMVFQVLVTILAIFNYVALTYLVNRADRNERAFIKNLDVFYATIFLLDYVLSFYTAEDRLMFYFNYTSLIDLVSIVTPFVYVFVTNPSKYVWFVGLMRIFRATRILRTYRLLSFSQSEETRELVTFVLNFLNFVFFSASLINAIETLVVDFNSAPNLLNWHDSLYYIMVTFSTIGFGDLTPNSTLSRIVVMFLIILVIVYVPYQTGRILDLYKSMSKAQRAKYTTNAETGHVIVSGAISYNSLIDFCREYFASDSLGHVVIMHTEEPTLEINRLLSHPFYRDRLFYLRADLMSIPDLKRAAAEFAMGFFLLNNQSADLSSSGVSEDDELRQTREVDAQILMQSLLTKNSFPGVPIFAQIQDSRSAELSSHCGCDRVICVDEIKMSLMATNCHVPGIQTLILNLIHTYEHQETDMFNEFWMKEYQCGAANQIFSFRIPAGLVGIRFVDVVQELFESFGIIIFALQSTNSGFIKNQLRMPIDPHYRLKIEDIAFCISDGGDESMLRIAYRYKDKQNASIQNIEKRELEKEMESKLDGKNIITSSPFVESPFSDVIPLTHTSAETSGSAPLSQIGFLPPDLENHIILCGHVTSRPIRNFVYSIRHGGVYSVDSKTSSTTKRNIPIVCLLEHLPEKEDLGVWNDILQYPNVYIVHGSAVKRTSLDRARIRSCQRIIILSKKNSNPQRKVIEDANAVFVVKLIQKEWPQVKFLVELSDGTNVKYFSGKAIEWDTQNLRTTAILNNYTLTVSDRLAVYRKLRAEGSEKTSFLYQLVQLMFGNTDETQNGAKASKNPAAKTKYRNKSYINERKERAAGEYDAIEDLNDADGRKDNVVEDEDAEEKKPDEPEKDGLLTEMYLQRLLEEAELNESGLSPYPVYHYDRHFAAGMIATTSFIDSLLCQSYFRPFIVDVVRALITHVVQLHVHESCAGKKYSEVFNFYLEAGFIPIGLYRNGLHVASAVSASRSRLDDPDERLPYVYTNCRQGDIVNQNDLIFAIRKFEP